MRKDRFTDEALAAAKALADLKMSDSESFAEAYDFARCRRPDGSTYPIASGKQCRGGTKTSDAEPAPKKSTAERMKAAYDKRQKEEARLKRALTQVLAKERNARRDGYDDAARKFMRASLKINKRLDEVQGARLTGAAPKRKSPAKKKESGGKGTPEQRMQLERLYDRLDDAVTIKEQERVGSAISDLQKRMRG